MRSLAACAPGGTTPAVKSELRPIGSIAGLRRTPVPTQAEVPLLVQAFEEMAFTEDSGQRRDFVIRWEEPRISVWVAPSLDVQHAMRVVPKIIGELVAELNVK